MENIDISEFSGLISNLLEGYLKPKIFDAIDKLGGKLLKKKNLLSHDILENKFKEYLENKVSNFLIIDTLVFPNFQTLINTIYEPLKITTSYQGVEAVLIEGYPVELFDTLYRILIQDTAGMGKSTMSRIMFLDAVNKSAGIPFHIELRKINSTNTIFNEICNQLLIEDSEDEIIFIKELIKRGDFIFILDGYDEVAFEDRELVAGYIHEILYLGDKCKFCLTSRPEAGLTSFGDFISFEITELSKEQAYSLFRRLDVYSHKPIADRLINAIEENVNNNSESTVEFLGNPLLASLLYKTFDFKKNLPDNLSQFYRQIYDALFENHDLSKEGYFKREKFTKLHIDDFEKILRCIGFQTSISGKNEFNKDQLITLINIAHKFFPEIKFRPSDFIKDIISTVPLFKKDGVTFKWSHKSLQDYFGAKFLYSDYQEKRDSILLKFFQEKSNQFLLKIYNSLDSKTFRRVCVKSFLGSYIKYAEEQFKIFRDTEKEEDIIEWINFSYARDIQFVYCEPEDFPMEILKGIQYTGNITQESYDAEQEWFSYLNLACERMLSKTGISRNYGSRGPLCNKYIYYFNALTSYSSNVLIDIYSELFVLRNSFSEENDRDEICQAIINLEQYKMYNLNDSSKLFPPLNTLNEFQPFISIFSYRVNINYYVAVKLLNEINDEIASAKVLDDLFKA